MIEQPQCDENGKVIPHDHMEIPDTFNVIRKISEEQIVEKPEGKVISSLAYNSSSGENGGMSVDIKELIERDGENSEAWVTTPRWIGSVIFSVSDLRGLGYMVGYDPIRGNPPNPYHGEIWGSFRKPDKNRLKHLAEWFVPIDDVRLF